ncbi:MAG: winged helix-turn-helix transcriptional regulator [Reyranella sp.]|jgi:DNA-binding transcriptional ArsR family regulator|uniref:ArsR/SmtB family transcription factor n=1 Tax=Reyranella sp. TaxID=1929291 RepID=UPI002600EDF6|nr:metalloregulator ArsR/SmtB family transcription factor [Reyranella sp.]MBR2814486.1 winged helix-turn-helix transcriptional regulator [Reyranella sp.]
MSKAKKPVLTDDHAVALADLFRLLGDPTRLKIVVSCLRTPLAVSDIADRLELSVSLVSHHLRLLKGARLVRAERQGKQVYYEADDAHVRRMVEDMVSHVAEH